MTDDSSLIAGDFIAFLLRRFRTQVHCINVVPRRQEQMNLSLRPASQADIGFCESLTRSNMSAYHSARGDAWDSRRFSANWALFENFMILVDDRVVGLLRLLVVDGALDIRDLQVLPAHRGHGIGSWAVGQVAAEATRRGIGTLRLRVFEDNPAMRLYARLGFEIDAIGDDGKVHMSFDASNKRSSTVQPLRSIGPVILGYLVFAVSAFAFFQLAGQPPHADAPPAVMLASIVVGVVAAFAGGYLAARLAGRKPLAHGLGVAALLALGAAVSLVATIGHGAIWSQVAALVLMAPGAALGGWVRART